MSADSVGRVLRGAFDAGDSPVRPRDEPEASRRRTVLITGRATVPAVALLFAEPDLLDTSRPRRLASVGAVAATSAVHVGPLLRLYRHYRATGRTDRVIPLAGVAHGVGGYAAIAVLVIGLKQRLKPLVAAGVWYTYVGLWIDLIDGVVRRRRTAWHYLPLAATLAAGAAARRRRG